MVTEVTQGIKVSVETFFKPDYTYQYTFAYRVTIENEGPDTIQLLSRHWTIFDSKGTHREIMGEGVVGEQPVLNPGETFTYIAGCHLETDIGLMCGSYHMKRCDQEEKHFKVTIPAFQMVAPFRMN